MPMKTSKFDFNKNGSYCVLILDGRHVNPRRTRVISNRPTLGVLNPDLPVVRPFSSADQRTTTYAFYEFSRLFSERHVFINPNRKLHAIMTSPRCDFAVTRRIRTLAAPVSSVCSRGRKRPRTGWTRPPARPSPVLRRNAVSAWTLQNTPRAARTPTTPPGHRHRWRLVVFSRTRSTWRRPLRASPRGNHRRRRRRQTRGPFPVSTACAAPAVKRLQHLWTKRCSRVSVNRFTVYRLFQNLYHRNVIV